MIYLRCSTGEKNLKKMRQAITLLLLCCSVAAFSQGKADTTGWPVIRQWISQARHSVWVLPPDSARASRQLNRLQLSPKSALGSIISNTGGIIIDSGLIRILGSGCNEISRNIADWNFGKGFASEDKIPAYLLVADDAIGGFYAINCGGLGDGFGDVYYLSPMTLEWENLSYSYTEFLALCFNGDIDKRYKPYVSSSGFSKDIGRLGFNNSYCFVPYLFVKKDKKIPQAKKAIPTEQLYSFYLDMRLHMRANSGRRRN
jgi:hypothetical protein